MPLGFGPDGIQGTGDDATLPEGAFNERFEYDDLGREDLHVSFEGAVTKMVYDDTATGGGRLKEKKFYPDEAAYGGGAGTPSETWTYIYDAYGRTIEVRQSDGTTTTSVQSPMTRRERLRLLKCHLEHDSMGGLSRLTSLRTLRLADTPLTQSQVAQISELSGLEELDLSNSGVAPTSLLKLRKCRSLRIINVAGLQLESDVELARKVRAALPNVEFRFTEVGSLLVPSKKELGD